MPTPAPTAIDLSLLDPYEAQALRDRDRAQVNQRWWLILAAAGTGLAAYAYLVLDVGSRVSLPTRALLNELTIGLALATGVSAIAIVRAIRARWPAAVSLAGAVLAWTPIARLPAGHALLARPADAVVLVLLALLVITSVLALVRRPPPPLEAPPTAPDLTSPE